MNGHDIVQISNEKDLHRPDRQYKNNSGKSYK